MLPPIEQLTADGYDPQFGTNKLLVPTMIATAKTTSDGKVRIVNTSSAGHLFGHLDFDTFRDSPARRKSESNSLYCQSKFVRPQICLVRPTEARMTGKRSVRARVGTAVRGPGHRIDGPQPWQH